MSASNSGNSRGYGPSRWQRLYFDGDERKFEQWLVKFLGYMRLQGLKDVIDPPTTTAGTPRTTVTVDNNDAPTTVADTAAATTDDDRNAQAFAELIQFLDDRSLSLVMRDALDNGREALKILKEHYQGTGKPRVLSLYTELTSLSKGASEELTDYILRAEKYASDLKTANQTVDDSLLIAMVLKGLPVQYKPFEVVITQNVTDELTFHDFKVALRSFEDTEKARTSEKGDSLMLHNNGGITCFKCKELGHKANVCPKHTGNSKKSGKKRWCIHCKTNTHYTKYCRKNPGGGNNGGSQNDGGSGSSHSFVMMMRDIRPLTNNMDKSFLVDSGSTAHTVNSDEHFVEYDEEFSPQQHAVTLADGTTQTGLALKKGTIEVMFRDKSGKLVLGRLEGVLFIPSYPQNLFSVQKSSRK